MPFKRTAALLPALLLGLAAHAQVATPQSVAAAMAKIPKPSKPLTVHLPRAKEYTLPNGLRLLVLEDHKLPTVAMTMRIYAGSFFEPKSKGGLADMTASMLDEGTKTRTSAQIAAAVDAMGASLGASAEQGGEMAVASASGLSTDTIRLMDLLADIVRNPTFPAGQFAKVKRQTVAGLVQETQDPHVLAEVAAMRALYGSAPPARVMPGISQVRALAPKDLIAFHAAYYRPERAILGVTGDVRPATVRLLVARAFGTWKRGSRPVQAKLPAFTPPARTRAYLVDRPGSVQTVIDVTGLGLARKSPDLPAVTVMNHILGGDVTSRLWMDIRETRGYAYDIGSTFETPRYPGPWSASGEVRNAVTADALKRMIADIRNIQEQPVTPDELRGAKESIVGHFARQLESPVTLLSNALDIVEYNLPADYWDTYPQRVNAVTAADVERVARKYLNLNHVQIVAVGQKSDIQPALAPYGPVTTLDLTASLR